MRCEFIVACSFVYARDYHKVAIDASCHNGECREELDDLEKNKRQETRELNQETTLQRSNKPTAQ